MHWSLNSQAVIRSFVRIASASFVAVGAVAALVDAPSHAQEAGMELAPLTFTASQARQGRAVFSAQCSACHGSDLGGLDNGPPLTGDTFSHWFAGPVSDLFAFIGDRMPADNPGILQQGQIISVIAYISEQNGFAAGDVALPNDPEALESVGFSQ